MSWAHVPTASTMFEGFVAERSGMGIAFVPFTFPTVMFGTLASDMGYDFSWSAIDDIWNAYSEGRATGKISKPGQTSEAIDYINQATWERKDHIKEWFSTAKEAATKTDWGQVLYASYFTDFGAQGTLDMVVQGAGNIVKSVTSVAADTTKKLANSFVEGLGLPKWIFWGIVILIVGLVVYFTVKFRYPKVSLS